MIEGKGQFGFGHLDGFYRADDINCTLTDNAVMAGGSNYAGTDAFACDDALFGNGCDGFVAGGPGAGFE